MKSFQSDKTNTRQKGWMVTPLGEVSKLANANSMISLDCEMAFCEDGTDAIIKVCTVDHNLEHLSLDAQHRMTPLWVKVAEEAEGNFAMVERGGGDG
ncbi:hypothetical protein Taro_040824, partial [Colocasia esculenta]|nr:hypothetical protein [Colocasia esculenta]